MEGLDHAAQAAGSKDLSSGNDKAVPSEAHVLRPEEEDRQVERIHEVTDKDTFSSISAGYDVTPSALAQHNKLISRIVFPGQKLRIPPLPEKKKEEEKLMEEPEIIDPQFVRLNVRHITDGRGIVSGSLLLTPKVVMFNPCPNDMLVAESDSPDRYQVVSPMELVVNIAILRDFVRYDVFNEADDDELYDDIFYHGKSRVRVKESSSQDAGASTTTEAVVEEPMYMRFLMGKPINKKLPRTTPVISYGEQHLEGQYWFIVPVPKAKAIHNFVEEHAFLKEKYGKVDVSKIERSGYEFIRKGRPVMEAEPGKGCNRETVAKSIRKTLTMTSMDLCGMVGGVSALMTAEDRLELARVMPARTDGHDWVLVHCTDNDGFNLRSLTRKLSILDSPVLLVIQDNEGYVFGAFLSQAPRLSEGHSFQGTGETFVFTLKPTFAVYRWTGENCYFFRLDNDSLVVGSGGGQFALWLDSDLNMGRTQSCSTFDNPALTPAQDFTLISLECWSFQ